MADAKLWTPRAWIAGRWQDAVLLAVNERGNWSEITAGVDTPTPDATILPGPVLPGVVNAHSHAFQRAFAGLSERRDSDADDFWAWRDRMYRVASRITPQQLRAVAAQLYVELLCGGYTQVCEFQYLHHDETGGEYGDVAPLVKGVAGLATAASAIILAFRGRFKWEPPDDQLSGIAGKTAGVALLAWLLPIGGILVGGVALGFAAWRWSRSREPAPALAGGYVLDPELDRRLDDELRRLD